MIVFRIQKVLIFDLFGEENAQEVNVILLIFVIPKNKFSHYAPEDSRNNNKLATLIILSSDFVSDNLNISSLQE